MNTIWMLVLLIYNILRSMGWGLDMFWEIVKFING